MGVQQASISRLPCRSHPTWRCPEDCHRLLRRTYPTGRSNNDRYAGTFCSIRRPGHLLFLLQLCLRGPSLSVSIFSHAAYCLSTRFLIPCSAQSYRSHRLGKHLQQEACAGTYGRCRSKLCQGVARHLCFHSRLEGSKHRPDVDGCHAAWFV